MEARAKGVADARGTRTEAHGAGAGGGPSEGCIGRGVRAKAEVSRDEQ